MDIPYTTGPRPDTGLYNGKLGMWLFLASEIMLFGGLFSAYVFLRAGSPSWPNGGDLLNVPLASANTVVLIVSSITMAKCRSGYQAGKTGRGRTMLIATMALGTLFVLIKLYEYNEKFQHGFFPSTSNFYGIYFVMTGMHLLHLAGGLVALACHLLLSGRLRKNNPEQFVNRIEVTGLYWHFVDVIWVVLFTSLYLI